MSLGAWMNRDEQGHFTHDVHADEVYALRADDATHASTLAENVRSNDHDSVSSPLDAPRRAELLAEYEVWRADREEITEREGTGEEDPDDWADSDDDAVALLHAMAELLRGAA